MKVQQILQYIQKYKSHLYHMNTDDQLYKWEVLQNFQTHWNEEAKDLHAMVNKALSSKKSGFLWQGEVDSPKSILLQMIAVDPEFVRLMFRDLFDESKELLLRMDRFGFHCDQLLPKVQKKFGKVIEHYHHDYKILSVYLALRYPQVYCIFDFNPFLRSMQKMGIQNPPQSFEIIRFNKLINTIQHFLVKDQDLVDLQMNRIKDSALYQESSLLLAHDFYWTCGNSEYNIEKY